MTGYIINRLLQMTITIFVISILVFVMVRLRGDPVTQMAPDWYTPQQLEELRAAWGMSGSWTEQYITFISRAVRGDFGQSVRYQRPAMEIVMERLPLTFLLAGVSAVIGLVLAVPLGIVSALRRNSFTDLVVTVLSTLGAAMPNFWIGLMLILLFSVQLRMLPAFGADSAQALIMPSLTLGLGMMARLSRLTRSAMLDVLNQDYIRTARAKGLSKQGIIWQHALRNAAIPVLTAFGLQLGWLLGGSLVVEQVFAWPGLGRVMLEAVNLRDLTLVQAGVFWFAVIFSLINLIVDLLYTVIDPRIRVARSH
jgi:peptide/nickel transport system permease protein